MTDDQILAAVYTPRPAFMERMKFKVQSERLLTAEIERRNGHPLRADDWIVVRQLCALARPSDNGDLEAQFAAAKQRVENWAKEVREGKPMQEAAREHNEDRTNLIDGLRNPTLRGTGTKALEDAVWALKPGEL